VADREEAMTDPNKRFAELAGWECSECGGSGWVMVPAHAPDCNGECRNCPVPEQAQCEKCYGSITDFTDAREVLKVMRYRDDWFDFCQDRLAVDQVTANWAVPIKYILDTTGLLRDEAIAFLEESYAQ
jgi:hypothetical protein